MASIKDSSVLGTSEIVAAVVFYANICKENQSMSKNLAGPKELVDYFRT